MSKDPRVYLAQILVGISPELVWSTVEERLPALREALEGLLPSLQDLEEELGRSSSPSDDKDVRS